MLIRRDCLDYPSEAYIYIYQSKCTLYVHGKRIKSFETYNDAYNYWLNEYCN